MGGVGTMGAMGRRLAVAGLLCLPAAVVLCLPGASPAAPASWQRVAPLPDGRADAGAVRALDRHGRARVYLVGGRRAGRRGRLSADVRVYLQGSDRWRRRASLPHPRSGAAVVGYRSRIFVVGGSWTGRRSGRAVSRALLRYDSHTDRWERRTGLPSARSQVAAAALHVGRHFRIFAVGGVGKGARVLSTVSMYLPERGRWLRRGDLPEPRVQAVAVAARGRIYVFGGKRKLDGPPTASVYMLHPGTGRGWRRLPDMPLPRADFGAALVAGRIYLVGGLGLRRKVLRSVQVFDPASGAWHAGPDLPKPRRALAVAATPMALLAIGGRARPGRTSPPLASVYRLRVGR